MSRRLSSPIPLDEFDASTGRAVAAIGLPPAAYTDEAFFEFECAAIFEREWHCLGRVEQIADPGDYFTTMLLGREPVIVARNSQGDVNVISSVCQHRGMCVTAPPERHRDEWFASPPEVCGHTRTFRCPYHWW